MSRPGWFHRVERIVLCISLCGLLAATVYAQSIPPVSTSNRGHTFHGIYGMGPAPNVTNKSYVDGIYEQDVWRNIEPEPGVFSWRALDAWIAESTRAGKHFTLTIIAGLKTPQWLYGLGAASVRLSGGTVPIPWDPTYLQYFKRMVAALGARYGRNPALDGVTITGLNYRSGETHLVMQNNISDCARWMRVGYSRSLIVSAFSQILNEFSDDFPNVQLSAAFIPGGFCAGSNTVDWTMDDRLIALGGFVPQNDGWSSNWILPNLTGYQEVYALGSSLPAALIIALAQRGTRYLQLYDADLENPVLAHSIAAARNVLLSR